MMQESKVIVPKRDNEGHDLTAVRESAIAQLIDAFGGVTVQESCGGWRDPGGKVIMEPVYELVSAYTPSQENDSKLRTVADYVREAGRQIAVYVRYAGGGVELVEGKETVAA